MKAGDSSPTAISPIAISSGSIYVGAEAPPVALRARRAQVVSLENETDLKLASTVAPVGVLKKGTVPVGTIDLPGKVHSSERDSPLFQHADDDLSAFVNRAVDQSFTAARQFGASPAAQAGASDGYPASKLGQKLRLISKLLKLDGLTRLYYASQSGYDTHSAQTFTHAQLLREFAAALKAFLDDLRAAKLDDRVVVLAFSEFGRRVGENASAGTDHGAAGPVFLAGAPVRAGVLNRHPSLADLDSGDLKMQVDFREVYAALLQNWLSVAPDAILNGPFAPFDCLQPVRPA